MFSIILATIFGAVIIVTGLGFCSTMFLSLKYAGESFDNWRSDRPRDSYKAFVKEELKHGELDEIVMGGLGVLAVMLLCLLVGAGVIGVAML